MKIKKIYKFDNKRQIWRIIPADEGKLIVEERDLEKKQAYFHCLTLDSGKKLLNNFQLDDKFWVGIEAVKNDIIYFHKFAKPDMPKHKGIYAFDIKTRKIFWENPDFIYQFILRDKLYSYVEKFGGRKFYALNPMNGEIIDELGENYKMINALRDESINEENNKGYLFPEDFEVDLANSDNVAEFIKSLRNNFVISGKIEYILKNQLLMMRFHEANSRGNLTNNFKAVDLSTVNYIL
ncbi:MAG TPA: DUF4905 domain-containing protein [Ignavibacteriaceae bacterium]